jgi:hypothetical protein
MKRPFDQIVSVLLLALIFLLAMSPFTGYASLRNGNPNQDENPPADTGAITRIYLPLVRKPYPTVNTNTIYGAETVLAHDPNVANKAQTARLSWVRSSAFSWKDIEPVDTRSSSGHATYNWSSVNEGNLNNLAARGLKIIGTIKYTPSWAQKYPPNTYCGPVAQAYFDEFAQFVTALINRYGDRVKYWEIGNEPDVDPSLVPGTSEFGCWGDKNDLNFYGGGYYAKMLEVVSPAIKTADPQAKLVIGGLLLDCDPTNPPAGNPDGCLPAKFFAGILDNNGKMNGANYFDILGFHTYAIYNGGNRDEIDYRWKHRGGVVLGKIDFLRTVMTSYGVNKPIIVSEGALACPTGNTGCTPVGSAFFEAQADFVVWYYVRTWAEGLIGTIWYRLDGESWRYCSLLDNYQNPKPAYNALSFLSQELAGATYIQKVTNYPNLRAYEFQSIGKHIWVMWSPDGQPYTINLPTGTTIVLDKYGAIITPVNNQVAVNRPVYVELVP